MSETLVTRFFDDRWMRENAKDVERARELTRKARAELAAMNAEKFATSMADPMVRAGDILVEGN